MIGQMEMIGMVVPRAAKVVIHQMTGVDLVANQARAPTPMTGAAIIAQENQARVLTRLIIGLEAREVATTDHGAMTIPQANQARAPTPMTGAAIIAQENQARVLTRLMIGLEAREVAIGVMTIPQANQARAPTPMTGVAIIVQESLARVVMDGMMMETTMTTGHQDGELRMKLIREESAVGITLEATETNR
jgi:hypothetical protein